MRIIVIGGGISGLSAAHRLVELSSGRNLPIDVILLEASQRLGGVISTRHVDGFLIEEGPDSFITTKPAVLNLCRRIGLDSQLIQTNSTYRRTFVVHRGRLLSIPEGFLMLAPARFLPFLISPLFSWRGKFRMLLDLVLPRAKGLTDESLASFVTRRLGREALDRVAQPLISGVYTADPEKLSLRATMPRFLEMEEESGSVIRAMIHEQNRAEKRQSGARYSMFMSFKEGMKTLVDALAGRLSGGSVRLNEGVRRVELTQKGWNVITDKGLELQADGIIITIPAYQAAAIVEGFEPSLAADLSDIQYASSAVISLTYRREDIPHPLDGFGFVVPVVERRAIIACSFSSVKFEGRAPEGYVLLRCFSGGALQPEIYEKDDSSLIALAHKEVCELLGAKTKPLFSLASRYPKSMPQYRVGHLEHVAQITEKWRKHHGLALAGSAYSGIGIPDCVRSGESAAEDVFNTLCQPAG